MPAVTTAAPVVAAHPGVFVQKKTREGRDTQRFCAPLQMPSVTPVPVLVSTMSVSTVQYTEQSSVHSQSRPETPTTPSSTHTVHNPYSMASMADEFEGFEQQVTPMGVPVPSMDEHMNAIQRPQPVHVASSPMSPYGPAYGPPVSPTGPMVNGFGMPQYPRYTVPQYPHAAPSPHGYPVAGYPAMPTVAPSPHVVVPGYRMMVPVGAPGTPTSIDGVQYPTSPIVSPHGIPMVQGYPLHAVSGPTTPTTPVVMQAVVPTVQGAEVAGVAGVTVDAVNAGESEAKKSKRRRKRRTQEENTAVDAVRYKTKLCKNWQTTNRCPYGPRCLFAHGGRELRTCDTNTDAIVLASAMQSPENAFYQVGRFPTFVPVPRDMLGLEEGEMPVDGFVVPTMVEASQQA